MIFNLEKAAPSRNDMMTADEIVLELRRLSENSRSKRDVMTATADLMGRSKKGIGQSPFPSAVINVLPGKNNSGVI